MITTCSSIIVALLLYLEITAIKYLHIPKHLPCFLKPGKLVYLCACVSAPRLLKTIHKAIKNHSFFLSSFSSHFFRGLAGACMNPGSFFKLSFCTFTCLSNNSLISSWISAKFVSVLLPCMLYLSYYFQSEVNT